MGISIQLFNQKGAFTLIKMISIDLKVTAKPKGGTILTIKSSHLKKNKSYNRGNKGSILMQIWQGAINGIDGFGIDSKLNGIAK